MKKTTLFRKLMLDKEIFVIPGCHDALSAKIVELVGFKAVTMGGYAASAASLAKPDVSLLTLTEYVNIARNIVQAVDLPVICGRGYGARKCDKCGPDRPGVRECRSGRPLY